MVFTENRREVGVCCVTGDVPADRFRDANRIQRRLVERLLAREHGADGHRRTLLTCVLAAQHQITATSILGLRHTVTAFGNLRNQQRPPSEAQFVINGFERVRNDNDAGVVAG